MPLSFTCEGVEKEQLVISMAALLLSDCGTELSAENLSSVITASNNSVPTYYPALFAGFFEKSGGVKSFLAGPSAGGGGGTQLLLFTCFLH